MKLGPHVQTKTQPGLDWAKVAPIVKSIGDTSVFVGLPDSTIRIYRTYFTNQSTAYPVDTANAILRSLNGYRHPNLYVEVWNEAHPTALQMKQVVDCLHAAGVKVAIGSWGTGDYTQADWDSAVASGADLIAVHAYWSAQYGPTKWNGYRWRLFWQPGQPKVVVTECGWDEVNDGPYGTSVGLPGYVAQGVSIDNVAKDLVSYANNLDDYVVGATAFTCGPNQDWINFNLDPVVPLLLPHYGAKPMNKRAYLHQFDQLGEQTVAAIATTLKLGGIDTVVVKTHQFSTFTGYYDTSPMKINSVSDVAARAAQFAQNGIRMLAWCVPMGLDLVAEANITASVAAQLGNRIELDLEPYAGFWDGDKTQLVNYIGMLKSRGLTVDIDFPPVSSGVDVWDMPGAARAANEVWAQTYWTDFAQPWSTALNNTLSYFKAWGLNLAKTGVIFPQDDPANFVNAANALTQFGVAGVGLWRMGTAGLADYTAFAQIPATTVVPNPTKPWQSYLDATASRASIAQVLSDLWSLGEGQRAGNDPGAADCIEASVNRIKSLAGLA